MSDIAVHADSTRPRKAWEKLKVKQTVRPVVPTDPESPVPPNHVRFVCLSDTHARIEKHPEFIPDGDVLLHAGDFTNVGKAFEVDKFNMFLGKLPHRFKVVIAGNHDMTFDDVMMRNSRANLQARFGLSADSVENYLQERNMRSVKELLTNCVYLEDSMTEVYGIKIYGSPWQPEFCDWGFNLPRGQPCLDKWNLIPDDTDVLITHGPPIGRGDMCHDGYRAGCVELLTTIQRRVRPTVHVFGHIHEGYGMTSDGVTTYINASTCNLQYRPRNPPIVFDIPLPDGVTKDLPTS